MQATRRGVEPIRRLLTFSRRRPMALAAVEVVERVRSIAQILGRTLGETVQLDLQFLLNRSMPILMGTSWKSRPGKGTTVTFVLPRLSEPPPADGSEGAAAVQSAERSLTILLVEDEPEVRHLLRQQLMRLGHRVLEAANGAEALELIEHVAEIDVLVTEAVMPGGCDGPTLIVRARQLRPAFPAVLVSGYWQEERRLPDVPLVAKPVHMADLAAALRSVTITQPHR
jgi:CheY-like chemotaxis protein